MELLYILWPFIKWFLGSVLLIIALYNGKL